MFKSKEKQLQQVDTVISTGTVIEGKIVHETSLRIDGKIYGEIKCEGDVYIGTSGFAEEKISAKNIFISGEVKGELIATNKIHIKQTGKVSGDVQCDGLTIDEGGIFNGNSTIRGSETEEE